MTKPNILFIMTDEMRFPPVYETDEIKLWREKYLTGINRLRKGGVEFLNHYAASTACAPSRASLACGQYPSLTGVSQTDGAAKTAFDSDMFWLDANTVPTIGSYFSTAGYKTFYKGKWHVSDADIIIPGTHDAQPSYNDVTGVPDSKEVSLYLHANRLNKFGWDDWVGPEPHGGNPRKSGSSAAIGLSGRDVVYTAEVLQLIDQLDKSNIKEPFFLIASLVNPHDIALWGNITKDLPIFNFKVDSSVPFIPPSPTANEDLSTKPSCQQSYKEQYQLGFQPTTDTETYRRLYYSLILSADNNINLMLDALHASRFADNTIVVMLSDHGDTIGAHNLFQKWYTAYEEAIHVPLIIKMPSQKSRKIKMLTSHVDILPTLLGLANINIKETQKELKKTHSEVRELVGRDLANIILGKCSETDEPIYFMTDDDVLLGQNQTTLTGKPYDAVIQPNHIETVITVLPTGKNRQNETWKYSRYFDNPQFWTNPCESNVLVHTTNEIGNLSASISVNITKTTVVPDQYELYNITADPIEAKNLAHSKFATSRTKKIQKYLTELLKEQSKEKRLYPNGSAPCSSPIERIILPRPA
ncbi:MAG: DUF229 domain-containing protein [Harvfovirus sp.]|uniref:DUF229 domain-containing protein n=1 Tax=Harvfovirus sp. TaxID=2487768 RepID=A0A3G5A1B9_9VIRU|nr:MAG: DUF229 domain-containing protein [Harvfovirus sp.]